MCANTKSMTDGWLDDNKWRYNASLLMALRVLFVRLDAYLGMCLTLWMFARSSCDVWMLVFGRQEMEVFAFVEGFDDV